MERIKRNQASFCKIPLFFLLIILATFACEAFSQAEEPAIDLLSREIRTPEDVAAYMKKNFRYFTDGVLFGEFDYWQSAEEMLTKKKGDCEDYAVFAKALLERNGYQVILLSLFWDEDAHTVAIFEKDGRWGVLNIDKLEFLEVNSLAELADKIHKNWAYVALMRKDGETGLISRKFEKHLAKETKMAGFMKLLPPAMAS